MKKLQIPLSTLMNFTLILSKINASEQYIQCSFNLFKAHKQKKLSNTLFRDT